MPQKSPSPARKKASATRDRMVLALLQHPTLEKAAVSAGVSESTLWRRLQDPDFQERYRDARWEAYSQAVARLQYGASAAATTLLRVMTDQNAPAASRVRAAGYVLDHATKFMEMENFEVRLAQLEANQDNAEDAK